MFHEEEIVACSPLWEFEQEVVLVRSSFRYECLRIVQGKDTIDY
jgi:hypothetical protein